MPAYIVIIREETLNDSEVEAYWSKAVPTLGGRSIKVLASNRRHVTLEGPAVKGMIVAEFPSLEDARALYESRRNRSQLSAGSIPGWLTWILRWLLIVVLAPRRLVRPKTCAFQTKVGVSFGRRLKTH